MKRIKSSYERKKINCWIRRGIGFFFVFVLVFRGILVEAGMNDSKLEKNRVENIYAISNINGQSRIFYLNMYTLNGIPSYCIEPGVDITTDIYHSTNDFGMSMLSSEMVEYIRSISYFGYGYPGHDDYRYYMATQELIWEYISGGTIEWSNVASIDGSRISIDSYKNEILELRKAYYNGLSLRFTNGESYVVGDKLVIYDQSGLLSSYEVESSGHSNAWIEGNTLQVEVARDYIGKEKIVLKRKDIYSYSGKLYYHDSSQRLISIGNFLEKREEISFYIEGVGLNFRVVDSKTGSSEPRPQSSFFGAVYELYHESGEFILMLMSNEFGKAFVSNLPYGNYFIRQIIPSEGYLCKEEDYYFTLDEENSYFLLEQDPIMQRIELLKLYNYRGEGNYIPELDISFDIYDLEGNFYDSIVTDTEGLASVILPYGHYIFKQRNTSFGYKKIDDFEIFVDSNDNIRYNLLDDFISCQLKINLKDSVFQDVSLGEGFKYKIFDVLNDKYLEYEGEDVFSTDLNGELVIPVLVGYGEYRIEQVSVPDGYVDRKVQMDIFIDDHSNFLISDGNLQFVIEFEQELKTGKVEILTEKEVFSPFENGYDYQFESRSNIVVDLIAQEDIVVYDKTIYSKGDLIQTISTNEKGFGLVSSLYLGNYCLKERESGVSECFTLVDDLEINLRILLEKMDIEFYNQSELGEEIEGSIVEVKDESGQVIYTGITDEFGLFKILSLPTGKYCFSQKEVGEQYVLYSDDVCLEIDSSKKLWNAQILNELIPKKLVVVPNTFYEGADLKKLLLIILLIFGGFLYKKKIISFFHHK